VKTKSGELAISALKQKSAQFRDQCLKMTYLPVDDNVKV
jgi:hypothetical protein